MKLSSKLFISVAVSGLLLAGCTSKVATKEQYSGFLPNYNNLQETTSPGGQKVLRWVAPGFDPHAYDAVVFNKLELYPAPKPNERVSQETLQELQAFTSAGTKNKNVLAQKYRVVNSLEAVPAGSRALVMHAAITGVSAANEGMRWYEVVPIAAAVGATQVATGHRTQDTELFIEADFVDAATGAPVVKVVRKVFGESLRNSSQPVTANDFKAAITGLTNDLQAFIK